MEQVTGLVTESFSVRIEVDSQSGVARYVGIRVSELYRGSGLRVRLGMGSDVMVGLPVVGHNGRLALLIDHGWWESRSWIAGLNRSKSGRHCCVDDQIAW